MLRSTRRSRRKARLNPMVCMSRVLPAVRRFYQDNNTTMTINTTTSITELVKAALIYSRPDFYTENQYDCAESKITTVVTKQDVERACPHIAASARILAVEVMRLWKEMTRLGVSHCCQWRATAAGEVGSTNWWECSFCRKPCHIVIPNNNTQPE